MKKKKIIIILAIILLILLVSCIVIIKFSKQENKIKEYDFTNKIFHYSGYIEGSDYDETYIFMSDGTFYNFTNKYDEECTVRSIKGTWKKNKNIIDINYEVGIFYDGGEIVETDDMAYFGKRRTNYNLSKNKYNGLTSLQYKAMTGIPGDKYMEYILIYDNTYYPIYEFDNEEDLYKKLEEMYGEVYAMLVDDSIEAIDNSNENIIEKTDVTE